MNSLTELYQHLSAGDAEILEKQAAMIKQAEEEDAAGRIMARGFADELSKLAEVAKKAPPANPPTGRVEIGTGGSAGGRARGAEVRKTVQGMFGDKPLGGGVGDFKAPKGGTAAYGGSTAEPPRSPEFQGPKPGAKSPGGTIPAPRIGTGVSFPTDKAKAYDPPMGKGFKPRGRFSR